MKIEQTECSETSAYKIQTPGNYPEENIQHTNLYYIKISPLALKTQMKTEAMTGFTAVSGNITTLCWHLDDIITFLKTTLAERNGCRRVSYTYVIRLQ